jgi:hypothetical protein
LLFLVLEKGSDLSAAIAEGEKARAIDPTLPDLSTLLVPAYAAVGLMARAPTDIPPAQFQFSELFYGGSWGELDKIIRGSDARLWTASDGDVAFFSLGARRDWGMLTGLFDVRPAATPQLCLRYRAASQSLVPALRAAGRPREAGELMKCMRDLLAVESKQKARAWDERQGQFEYDQATVAALDGKPKVAIRWLGQAVDRGWIGLPYSTRIGDRPQFDSLRTDRRVTALQTRISATIMRERDEILSRKNELAGQP